jgi:hypothetical protein
LYEVDSELSRWEDGGGDGGLDWKQERIDITRSDTQQGLIGRSVSKSEQIREVHTVMPGELQSLPPLAGYLTISDGTPAARVTIEAQGYGKRVKRFVPIEKKEVPPITSS